MVPKTTGAEIVLVEVGGTVGDIESLPFLEALRQMRGDVGTTTHSISMSPGCRSSVPLAN